jgi:hypothetical protein
VGRPLTELGGEVDRWLSFKGGKARRQLLAGQLGSAKLWCVLVVPPDASVLLPLELLAPSVQVEAVAEPLEVAKVCCAPR